MDWKKTVIRSDTPILDAISVIELSNLQIALVTNEEGQLLGTVTDGDVRRGILQKVSLNQPVSEIMNCNPRMMLYSSSTEQLITVMEEKLLRHIPLVNEDGILVGLEVLQNLKNPPILDNIVLLMAGGEGKRLRPLTENLPKPLLNIGGKPILETIMGSFKEIGFTNYLISVNYGASLIKKHFGNGKKWSVDIEYLHEDKFLGTAGPISLMPKRPNKPFIVMNGDILTTIDFERFLQFHNEQNAAITLCVREYNFQVPFGVVSLQDNVAIEIKEKPTHTFFVNAGIYVIEPDIIDLIPKNEFYNMTDLINDALKRGLKVSVFPVHEYWTDIGTHSEFERATTKYFEYFT
jgi:dTDP-glucose pyrophosphorylase